MLFFTICASNYFAHASVLARSIARVYPGQRLQVLLIDGEPPPATDAPLDILRPADLPFDSPRELHRMAAIYDVTELATALKPWAFRALFARGEQAVVFLDPDIRLFAPLEGLEARIRDHGIVLTPHSLRPMPRDGRQPDERRLLIAGAFNLGFLALSSSAGGFLDWWSGHLRRDCVSDPARGLFVDQKWIDLVPGYFDHAIVRDPGWNVAYWNVGVRVVAREGDRYTVDGVPLRFFHFSGYSPRAPRVLTRYEPTAPRVLLSEHRAVAELCDAYAEALHDEGYERRSRIPYGFGKAANSLPIDARMRRLFRADLQAAEAAHREPTMPDPFDEREALELTNWLNQSSDVAGVSRYLLEVYRERADLQAAFPEVRSGDADRFLRWLLDGGTIHPPAPEVLLQTRPQTRAVVSSASRAPRPGVNLYGYTHSESGTGQIVRSIAATLESAGIPFSVIRVAEQANRQNRTFHAAASSEPEFDLNVICVNADQLPVFASRHRDAMTGRYNIGVWAWEIEHFPDALAANAALVDEIWGISAYTADSIRRRVSRPVEAFLLPVDVAQPARRTRSELGLPDGFLFLFCFDFNSVARRKNAIGTLRAFRTAFPDGEASLVIKTVNGDRHIAALEELRMEARDGANITVMDSYRSAEEQSALVAACDAYVSLHRAEGFGLTIAEAMALGKPVIATDYAAPREFLTARNSYLVPATLSVIGEGSEPYPPDAMWAEPDLETAARLMRRVFDERDERAARGSQARSDIETLHSPSARAPRLEGLLEQARARVRSAPRPSPPEPASLPVPAPADPALDRLAVLLNGPDPDRPSRMPWIARPLRRVMLRVIRNFWVHQREVDTAIVDALRRSMPHRPPATRDEVDALRRELDLVREQLVRDRTTD